MKKRSLRKTLLIVGEGYCEVAFLEYLRGFPAVRGRGRVITIRNARGKGAAHVVRHAVRLKANFSYDEVAVLIDTDTDWSDAVARQAQDNGVQVLPSTPCFEAMLLRALGERQSNARGSKQKFARRVGHDGTKSDHYRELFREEYFESMRQRDATLDALLRLFGL